MNQTVRVVLSITFLILAVLLNLVPALLGGMFIFFETVTWIPTVIATHILIAEVELL